MRFEYNKDNNVLICTCTLKDKPKVPTMDETRPILSMVTVSGTVICRSSKGAKS